MLNLPQNFMIKYQTLLGEAEASKFFSALNEPSKKAFRLNSLKNKQSISYPTNQPVSQIPHAYYGAISGQDPEWVSGTVYSQDPSAMFPAVLAGVVPGERILDFCAAPGGKSLKLGEDLQGQGLLVANEISTSRAKSLRENIERWGISNAVVTNESPQRLAGTFAGFFDKIIVDAPCSGEGMFRKNPAAIDYWSDDYVTTCQTRQEEILTAALKMLKPGGQLIYSTCTFAPEEDEQIVAWLVTNWQMKILSTDFVNLNHGRPEWGNNLPDINRTLRFWPQDDLGEGQFAAKLQLPQAADQVNHKAKKRKQKLPTLTKEGVKLVSNVLDEFNLPLLLTNWREVALVSKNHVFIPAIFPAKLSGLKVLNNGLELGILKKRRFEPSHQLAMVLSQVAQERVLPLTRAAYQAYLHGETVQTQSELQGFVLVAAQGLIFSFGKLANRKILKNFYPKGLRTLKKEISDDKVNRV